MIATPRDDLRRRAASLVLRGFRGLAVGPGDAVVADLRQGLSGVVLFDVDGPSGSRQRNVASREQLAALTAALAAAAHRAPPLIAVDQEGGQVRRLKERHGFPPAPSARQLGAGDPAATGRAAAALAEVLAGAGINLNLAPVVDVDVHPGNPIIGARERSFSSDPEAVAAHAAAFVRAHRERGVLTCLKHFPGHGSSRDDSHVGFTDVTRTWSRAELIPYERLLAEGLVDAVMTAHVYCAGLDEAVPATLSPATIGGLLRGDLGFDGVVISDDLGMGAITRQFGFEEAVARCLGAGVDLLALANQTAYDEAIAGRTAELIVGLVESKRLAEARVDEAAERVARLRARLAAGREVA